MIPPGRAGCWEGRFAPPGLMPEGSCDAPPPTDGRVPADGSLLDGLVGTLPALGREAPVDGCWAGRVAAPDDGRDTLPVEGREAALLEGRDRLELDERDGVEDLEGEEREIDELPRDELPLEREKLPPPPPPRAPPPPPPPPRPPPRPSAMGVA